MTVWVSHESCSSQVTVSGPVRKAFPNVLLWCSWESSQSLAATESELPGVHPPELGHRAGWVVGQGAPHSVGERVEQVEAV